MEALLRSLSEEELERALVDAAEREGVELGEWELERRAPSRPRKPLPDAEAARAAAGPPAVPAIQGEPREAPARGVREAPTAVVDPDPPRPEMVAAPANTGPRIVYGHAINLEAVEEQDPEPRPEMVRAPERPRLGPEVA